MLSCFLNKMCGLSVLWVFGLLLLVKGSVCVQTIMADFEKDETPTPDMVRNNGYVCEVHHVTTEDGYILELHRIPRGKTVPLNCSLPPVILQHGLFGSSVDWVLAGPASSLAYILADLGYDVWLGNARGVTYSRNHTTLDPDSVAFWNFTWHEMGYYDIPAVIDYVLATTGHSKLHYVGHSMGTSMFFVLTSTRPEYNHKVVYMVALAPIAYLSHATTPIRVVAPFAHDLQKIVEWFGHGEFLPSNSTIVKNIRIECSLHFVDLICENSLLLYAGYDPVEFNLTLLPVLLGHDPAGTSVKTFTHYAQLVQNGRFQQFDHGAEKNKIIYNSTSPPQYNISQISVPMTLFYGENDLLGDPTDVKKLFRQLTNPVELRRVNHTSFNHIDFIFAKHMKSLVNLNVAKWLREHQPPSFPASQSCLGLKPS